MDYKLVLVEWEDSAQPVPSWQFLDEADYSDVVICRSVGWLVWDSESVKALAPNIGNMGTDVEQGSGIIRIPARCVRSVTPLVGVTSCAYPLSHPEKGRTHQGT